MINPCSVVLGVQLWFSSLLHEMLPPDVEATVSALFVGAYFALMMLPVAFVVIVVRIVDSVVVYVAIAAIMTWYAWIIATDKAPYYYKPCAASEKADAFYEASFRYFPTKLTATPRAEAAMKQKKLLIFAVHPHGIHCWPLNMFAFRASELNRRFPELKPVGLAAWIMFKLPGVREIFLYMGYVDASRHVARRVLESGHSIFVCTGGEKESLLTRVGEDCVVLNNRKGFVRLALATGAEVVPVYGFGVSDLYETYDLLSCFRNWIQSTLSICLPIFHGRFFSPLPYKKPIHIVIGDPVQVKVPTGDSTESEAVDKAHAAYLENLKKLHKEFAPPGRKLVIC